jgi:hypothetical protein
MFNTQVIKQKTDRTRVPKGAPSERRNRRQIALMRWLHENPSNYINAGNLKREFHRLLVLFSLLGIQAEQ